MGQILLADLTFKVPGSPVTTQTLGVTNGLEYLGANAPRVYASRILEFVNLRRDVVSNGKTFGPTDVSGGILRLANPDGEYDDLRGWGTGGAAVFRLVDDSTTDFNDATVLCTVIIRRVEADLDEVKIHLVDRSFETDQPFQTDFYAGTNSGSTGVEGLPGDLKGKPVVDALGYQFQAPLPFANESALIMQLDSERISAIATNKVYDGLVGVTRGTARASLAALQAGTPGAGTFDYYLGGNNDGAYIKLGTKPVYAITADFDGKAPGGTFLKRPGELFDWVLQNRAGVSYLNISSADLAVLLTSAPYDLGMWIDQPIDIRDVLDRIAASLPGYWYVDNNGSYRLKQAHDPTVQTPVATFKVIEPTDVAKATDGDIISVQLLSTNDAGGGVPADQVTVKYKRFAQVTELGFDTASTAAVRSEAKNEWRTSVATDATVGQVHEQPAKLEFETVLVNAADAATVASSLLALYSVRRDRFKVAARLTPAVAALLDLGVYVRVEFPRYGLDAGKVLEVRGLQYRGAAEDDADDVVEMDLWG